MNPLYFSLGVLSHRLFGTVISLVAINVALIFHIKEVGYDNISNYTSYITSIVTKLIG